MIYTSRHGQPPRLMWGARRAALAIAAAAASLLAEPSGFAATRYDATPVLTSDGLFTDPIGLNDGGLVVGEYGPGDGKATRSFSWQVSGFDSYAPFGSKRSAAMAIDAGGDVAGFAYTAKDRTGAAAAYLRRPDGTTVELFGDKKMFESIPRAINSTRTIVGLALPTKFDRGLAFMWKNGKVTWLGTLGGPYSEGYAINDAGTIAGASWDAQVNYHAFQWSRGTLVQLPDLGGGSSQAYAINSVGTIVGYATLTNSQDLRACQWVSGAIQSLGIDDVSAANSINDAGVIVGGMGYPSRAFIWQDGQFQDLNDLVDNLPRDATLVAGWRINNAGQILASSTGHKGLTYLLTPKP